MSTRIMPQFELLAPQSVDEAVKDLAQYKEKAAVLAGGTDLLIMMKDENKWEYVLSLAEIPDLDYVLFDPKEGLRIGAMARLTQVLASPVVKERYRALWKAADRSGSPQTRAMATVVGNILRASRTGDCNIAILALGGTVVLRSAEGIREVVVDDFWVVKLLDDVDIMFYNKVNQNRQRLRYHRTSLQVQVFYGREKRADLVNLAKVFILKLYTRALVVYAVVVMLRYLKVVHHMTLVIHSV
ncbi:MAG TPA: FAD binding domain-containing protein, partial [Thermodesulfobacteriota bacterium]|nr:FAD binding domain-containing protein [Thermodesulfobacteriota bacterium]